MKLAIKLLSIPLLLITFLPFYLFTFESPALAECIPAQADGSCSRGSPCGGNSNTCCTGGARECSNYAYETYRQSETEGQFRREWHDPDRPTIEQEENQESINAAQYVGYTARVIGKTLGDLAMDEQGGGAINAAAGMIASTIGNPPVYTGTYIADITSRMGIVTPAYAQDQGTGWTALTAVLKIWKAFRNIAYLGFVLIFVIVGFMIMFRAQINPQTVVTIQAALPKIVFTLLLVTFSYAIASLMIDLIYVLIYLMIGVLDVFGVIQSGSASQVIDMLLSENGFAFAARFLSPLNSPTSRAANAIGTIVADIVNLEALGRVAGWITDILAYVIIAVAILIALFKLFFQLLMAYIGIIFSVIFAPITLLFNALPNSNSFSSWLKGLFANTIIFPIVALLFILAGALTGAENISASEGIGFQGGITQRGQALVLPFVGGGFNTDAIQAIIGIGCIMIMPKIVEMVQKMLGIEGGLAGAAQVALGGVMAGPQAVGSALTFGLAYYQPLSGGARLVRGMFSGKRREEQPVTREVPPDVEVMRRTGQRPSGREPRRKM